MPHPITIRLNAVIVAVTDEVPRVLTLRASTLPGAAGHPALPYGPLDTDGDPTLESGLRRWVQEQTGLEIGYAEQLYTFGDLHREPATPARILSVTYLALIREQDLPRGGGAWWQDWYKILPWEDHREGRPAMINDEIVPQLDRWAERDAGSETRAERHERIAITFGLDASPWDPERALERYELLWEAGLVKEFHRDNAHLDSAKPPPNDGAWIVGRPMAFDHRRIVATALSRMRGKLQYRPVIFELLPECFTLRQMQQVVEALAGVRLHKQNFRRLIDRSGMVEGTGQLIGTGGRPAELFRFRREVLRERPAPGVGLPGRRG